MKVRRDTNGVHLFDRWSGLNILLDEISVPPHERDPAPRFVSIALTNLCDLKCSFCYAPKHRAMLDSRSVISWAIQLDDNGCMGLGFGGGEPTLHPEFVWLCQQVAARTKLAVSFTTHGHRLTNTMAEQLSNVVSFVRVSMDGVDETYEQIRNRRFSVLIEKLGLARRMAPFGVNYVVNSATIGDLDSAAAIAFEQGASELLLLPEQPIATDGRFDESTHRMLAEWVQRNSQYRLAISESSPLEGFPLAVPFSDDDRLTAYAHIDASGGIRTSSFSPESVAIRTSVLDAIVKLRSKVGAVN